MPLKNVKESVSALTIAFVEQNNSGNAVAPTLSVPSSPLWTWLDGPNRSTAVWNGTCNGDGPNCCPAVYQAHPSRRALRCGDLYGHLRHHFWTTCHAFLSSVPPARAPCHVPYLVPIQRMLVPITHSMLCPNWGFGARCGAATCTATYDITFGPLVTHS